MKALERYNPIVLDATMANLLYQEKGAPAIRLCSLAYRQGDIPTAYEESILRGDRLEIVLETDAENSRGARFIKKDQAAEGLNNFGKKEGDNEHVGI